MIYIKYLGFIISTHSISVDLEKTKVIEEQKYFNIVKDIQLFLGFYNFYHQFIKEYRRIATSLIYFTKASISFHFDTNYKTTFEKLKLQLIIVFILQYYNPVFEYIIKINISNSIVIEILNQKYSKQQFSITYFSKTIIFAELNYKIYDKEILTIIKTIKK